MRSISAMVSLGESTKLYFSEFTVLCTMMRDFRTWRRAGPGVEAAAADAAAASADALAGRGVKTAAAVAVPEAAAEAAPEDAAAEASILGLLSGGSSLLRRLLLLAGRLGRFGQGGLVVLLGS